MAKTTDAAAILRKRLGESHSLDEAIAEDKVNVRVAMLIYDARTTAGMTQAELAALVGTKQQVIARLEDADYQGHSLSMLRRIATALNQRLEISFMPGAEHQQPAWR